MAEYIDKNAAITMADYAVDEHPYEKREDKPETFSEYNQGWNDACDYIRDMLEDMPAADVAPVKYGKWIKRDADGEAASQCSVCKYPVSTFWSESTHCPHCGAKMDLED